jgi:anaerobic selenocysteine-containing dehydrogenase
MRAEDINTEVFFMPAAAHTEKDGSFTNTQRMLQWHHTAVEPAGDARSDLWFMYHLGRRIRQKLAAAAGETVLGQSARERVVRGRFHRPHRGGPAARRGLSGSVIRLPPGAGNTVG